MSAAFAPSMSVSRRSPTTSGFVAAGRRTASACRATPACRRRADAGRSPLRRQQPARHCPAADPRASAACCRRSSPPTTRRRERPAPLRQDRHTGGRAEYPCTTASGRSSALATTRRPARSTPRAAPAHRRHEHGRTRTAALDQAPGRSLRRRDDVVRTRRHSDVGEMCRDCGRFAGGVVRHEREPHTELACGGQRGGRTDDRVRPEIDDTVEIEQRDVVLRRQRFGDTRHVPSRGSPCIVRRRRFADGAGERGRAAMPRRARAAANSRS